MVVDGIVGDGLPRIVGMLKRRPSSRLSTRTFGGWHNGHAGRNDKKKVEWSMSIEYRGVMAAESANERVDFLCLTAQPPGCRYPSHFFLLGLSFKASGEGEVFVTEGACISA